jgi:hypothetical protein
MTFLLLEHEWRNLQFDPGTFLELEVLLHVSKGMFRRGGVRMSLPTRHAMVVLILLLLLKYFYFYYFYCFFRCLLPVFVNCSSQQVNRRTVDTII